MCSKKIKFPSIFRVQDDKILIYHQKDETVKVCDDLHRAILYQRMR